MTTTIDDATMRALRVIIQQELSNAASVQAAAQAIAKGVTQYIGARYVPLFAEPLQWDSTKEYEPLTIVLYQGNSYTTRQYTPAGIEITNEAFWAETGNYNAQIEQYRQEVLKFDGRISNTENDIETLNSEVATINAQSQFTGKKIMFVTDSWGVAGAAGSNVQTPYPNLVCNILGATLVPLMQSGTGFLRTAGGSTFRTRLTNYAAANDTSDISAIFLMQSINDSVYTNSELETEMLTTVKYCLNTFKNAHIYMCPPFVSQYALDWSSAATVPSADYSNPWCDMAVSGVKIANSTYNRFSYINGAQYALPFSAGSLMHSDKIHPNQAGSLILSRALADAILGIPRKFERRINLTANNPILKYGDTQLNVINCQMYASYCNGKVDVILYANHTVASNEALKPISIEIPTNSIPLLFQPSSTAMSFVAGTAVIPLILTCRSENAIACGGSDSFLYYKVNEYFRVLQNYAPAITNAITTTFYFTISVGD